MCILSFEYLTDRFLYFSFYRVIYLEALTMAVSWPGLKRWLLWTSPKRHPPKSWNMMASMVTRTLLDTLRIHHEAKCLRRCTALAHQRTQCLTNCPQTLVACLLAACLSITPVPARTVTTITKCTHQCTQVTRTRWTPTILSLPTIRAYTIQVCVIRTVTPASWKRLLNGLNSGGSNSALPRLMWVQLLQIWNYRESDRSVRVQSVGSNLWHWVTIIWLR